MQTFEEGPVVRIEEGTVGVEETVLDDDGDLAILLAGTAARGREVSGRKALARYCRRSRELARDQTRLTAPGLGIAQNPEPAGPA